MDISEWIINELGSHDKKIEYAELESGFEPRDNAAELRQAVQRLIEEGKVLSSK